MKQIVNMTMHDEGGTNSHYTVQFVLGRSGISHTRNHITEATVAVSHTNTTQGLPHKIMSYPDLNSSIIYNTLALNKISFPNLRFRTPCFYFKQIREVKFIARLQYLPKDEIKKIHEQEVKSNANTSKKMITSSQIQIYV